MSNTDPSIPLELRKLLHAMRDIPPRDPEAAAQGRAQFLAEVDSLEIPVSTGLFSRHTLRKRNKPHRTIRKERIGMIPLLTSWILAFALLAGGAGATAYASQDALPGDTLFPVKTALEQTQLTLSQDQVHDLQLQSDFMQKRIDEIAVLLASGRYDNLPEAEALFESQLQQIDQAMLAAAEHHPEQVAQIAERMNQALAQHTQTLSILMDSVPPQAQPVLEHAMQASQQQQQAIQQHWMQPPAQPGTPDNPPEEHPGNTPMETGTPDMGGGNSPNGTPGHSGQGQGDPGSMNPTPSQTPGMGSENVGGGMNPTTSQTPTMNSENIGGGSMNPSPSQTPSSDMGNGGGMGGGQGSHP